MTMNASASPRTNCSLPSTGDYCHLSQEVVFPVGVATQELTLQLVDDQVAEGEEIFYVQLMEGEGLINAIVHGNVRLKVIIEDTEDYHTVFILGQSGSDRACLLETSVTENSGHISINISRQGNLEQEVGVVCYTESNTAQGGADYMSLVRDSAASTVVFGVNQSIAQCVVDIINDRAHENRERFFVRLAPNSMYPFINIDPGQASICVYINYAEDDSPVVRFSQTAVSVRERQTESINATFTLDRHGYDLNTATLVKYIYDRKDGDRAEENVDFRLYITDACRLVGDSSGGGCVSFAPGETTADLTVQILPDTLHEGSEVFHLKIVYVRDGMRTTDHRFLTLSVTIIDAEQPTYIEFVSVALVVQESSGHNQISLQRRGYVQGTVMVTCILKGITASGGFTLNNDFFLPPSPETVTFHPGETEQFCSVYIVDDLLYEGVESFSAELELAYSSDPGVIFSPLANSTTVFIVDPEDNPTVQFASDGPLYQLEPLSNASLDVSEVVLTLVRTGDLTLRSRVRYVSVNGSAESGRDYLSVSGVITFAEGESLVRLVIPLLANHELREDTNFTLELFPGPEDYIHDVTSIGANHTVVVVIQNRNLLGSYFPSIPQLCSVEEMGGVRTCTTDVLYFDLPLMCVTSCDQTFDPVRSGNWTEECEEQDIDNQQTIYTWQTSTDGEVFHTLSLNSVFISASSAVLQTGYLQPHLFLRCSAQAVNREGVRGYNRTSAMVQLSRQRYACSQQERSGRARGSISTYEEFVGADEDLVQVEFAVSAYTNSLPVVSMGPLSHPHDILQHVHAPNRTTPTSDPKAASSMLPLCSTLNMWSGHSLLSHDTEEVLGEGVRLLFQPLYSHLDRSRCEWRFGAWYSLTSLREDCGGVRTGVGGAEVSINATVTHLQLQGDGTASIHGNQSRVVLSTAGLTPNPSPGPLHPPLHLLPDAGPSHFFLFPMSTSRSSPQSFQVVLYMATPTNTTVLPTPADHQHLQLLFSSHRGTINVWQLKVAQTGHVGLEFSSHHIGNCTVCEEAIFFSLSLGATADGGVELILEADVILQRDRYTIGDRVNFTASLHQRQQLQGGNLLQVQQLFLCEQVTHDNCSNRLTLLSSLGSPRVEVEEHRLSPHSVSMEFPTDKIILLSSQTVWFLHLRVGLSKAPLSRDSQHAFMLLSAAPTTTAPTAITTPSTPTRPEPALSESRSNSTFTFAAIGILAATVIIVLLCVGVVVGVVCTAKGKASFRERAFVLSKESEELNSVRRLQNRFHKSTPLKRTSSTTGFPTQDCRLKVVPREGLKKKPADSLPLHRSQSLPSIFSPHFRGKAITPLTFPREPVKRRVYPRGHTRVKKLNVDAVDHTWTAEQLKASRELSNLKVVQDLVLKRSKYGVNEVKGQQGQSSGPYGRYVVTSLAASAKTPEPGSNPISLL